MTPAEARRRLTDTLETLRSRQQKVENHLRNRNQEVPRDWEEAATHRENDEVLEFLDGHGRSEIEQIESALRRLDRGTYGQCARCEETIDPRRLDAIPFTALCTRCAASE